MPAQRTSLAALLFLILPLTSTAQAPATPAGGTITGHVFCADTHAPARFAKVMLKSASPGTPGNDIFSALSQAGSAAPSKGKANNKSGLTAEEQAEQKEQLAAATKMMAGFSDLLYSATVAADGTYTFHDVKPGTYYIHATVPGYIDPYSSVPPEDLTSTDPEVRKLVAATLTPVTIDGTSTARADLTLERGASITGRVLYDDGSPAVGWAVKPYYPPAPGPNPFAALGVDASDIDLAHLGQQATTDDTGRFRIAGLSPGDYTLQARLVAASLGTNASNPNGIGTSAGGMGGMASLMGLRLTVYSGNSLRQSDAKPIHVTSGEDRTGFDITMPLHALHSVSGRVTAPDGHPINSASIELTAQDASGKDDPSLRLTGTLHPDGTFHFDYVPGPITYTLKVTRARDTETVARQTKGRDGDEEDIPPALLALAGPQTKTTHTYGPATTTIQLTDGDLDNIAITVIEAKPAANGN